MSRPHAQRRRPVDPALIRALTDGTYVVDARAVADAMLRRNQAPPPRSAARRLFDR